MTTQSCNLQEEVGEESVYEKKLGALKNGIHSFSARRSAYKRDSVENKPASLLAVSLSKALNGTSPPLCGRQVAYPYFTGLQL